MMTTHSAAQRSILALIFASVALLGLTLGPASAASLSLGYDGNGIFPQAATANSQRWFRVTVSWNTTDITDGGVVYDTERVTGLYLDQGIESFNTSVNVGGVTYAAALNEGEGLKNFFESGIGGTRLPGAYASQATAFGVYRTGSFGNYELTIGPFSRYEWSLLLGRINQTGTFRFRLEYESYSTSSHSYVAQSPIYISGSHITTPVAAYGTSNPRVPLVTNSGELQAWTSGMGTGLDPLTVTKDGVVDGTDNGSGSDRYTFRTRYFSGLSGMPALPIMWRSANHGSGGYHVDFDRYAYYFYTSGGTHDHSRKDVVSDSVENDWTYDDLGTQYLPGDPHQDKIGDGGIGSYNPEAILIVDRDYDNPYYMVPETGSYSSGRDYRYDLVPTNFLQLLNNIFTLQFDTPYSDKWDTYASSIRGLPTSNGYVAMRAGGHTYEFLTTRDFHPPVAEITSAEQRGERVAGPRAIALRGRPGNSSSLEAIYIVCRGYHGQSGRSGHYTQRINSWVDDTGAGGYGYPFDSQDLEKYPKVNPVLSAHPLFQTGNAGGLQIIGGVPQNPEKGRPDPWSMLGQLGPGLPGASPNPFDPSGSGLPWGPLNGPPGPQRFTNQDTIWPDFVNTWPETAATPFRGGKWTEDSTFVFRINYWQSDNFAPQYIQVWIQKVDQNGAPIGSWQAYSMQKADPTAWDFRQGVVYYFERSGTELGGPGDYRYYFKAGDGTGVAIYPNRPNRTDGYPVSPPNDPGQIGVPPGNNDFYWFRINSKPQLANNSVSPISAPQGSSFIYRVTYADQDGKTLTAGHKGDPPFKTLLHIDYSGDALAAKVASGSAGTTLKYDWVSGSYEYYADNELQGMYVRFETGASAGKEYVIDGNSRAAREIYLRSAPTVSPGDVFRIWFVADMEPTNPGDTTYTDGAQFQFDTARAGVDLDRGTHRYYFEFWDNWAYWINWQQYFMDTSASDPVDYKVEGEMVRYPAAGYFEGPEVIYNTPPHLARFYFKPPADDSVQSVPSATQMVYNRIEGLPPYTDDEVRDMYLEILSGVAAGKVYRIAGNTAADHTITFEAGVNLTADGVSPGNHFRIFAHRETGADGHDYLSWGYDPPSADGTPANGFYLYVTYFDAENNSPSVLRVRVNSQTYGMTKVDPSDSVYTDGVEYVTTAPVYLDPGSHTFKAQAYDGSAWYGQQYGQTPTSNSFYGPLVAGSLDTPADGPDVAPNTKPRLEFEIGRATVATLNGTSFTYNDIGVGEDNIGTNPIVTVLFDINGDGTYETKYRVQSHNPVTDTIQLRPGSNPGADGVVVGAPFIAQIELDPPSGLESDTYTYWIEYTDTDNYAGVRGNPPEYVSVFIDGSEHAMIEYDAADTDMTDGKVYYFRVSDLSVSASHTYYFMASDGRDTVRNPAAPNVHEGPAVHVNRPPVLADAQVDPATGTEQDPPGSGTPRPFTFRVTYTDPDNHEPSEITLHVRNTSQSGASWLSFSMTRVTEGEGDFSDEVYTNGEFYKLVAYSAHTDTTVPRIGDGGHEWYVTATDRAGLATRIPTAPSNLSGPTINDPPNPPTSGFSPAGGAIVDVPRPTMTWAAATDPNATDTPNTLRYTVQFSKTDGEGFTVEAAYTATTAAGVRTAQPAADLTEGTWYWRVLTTDDSGEQSAPSAVQSFVVDFNHAPYWAGVNLAEFTPTGTLVEDTTPEISWPDAKDDDPGDLPSVLQYRVQIDDNSDFNAPEYDSGWITVADRPITVPAGVLSVGQTYYWRVMARDDDEKPSGWTSDPTSASPPGLGRVFQFNIVANARPNPPGAGTYRPSLAVDGGEAHTELVTFEFPAGSDPNVTHTPDVLRYEVQLDLDDDWADGVNLIAETDRISAPGVTRVVMTVESSRLGPDEVGVDDLRYWWRVRTIDPLGATSDWTGSQSFYLNTVNEPPRAPSSGFAPSGGEVVTTAQPLLRWDATTDPDVATDPPGTLHYVVQLSTDASFGSVAHEYTTGVGQTQAQVTAALAGRTEWFWRVRAIDDENAAGEWSAAQSFRVDLNRAPYWAGVNLAAFTPTGPIVGTTPELNWPDANDDDPDDLPALLQYRVQIDDNSDFNAPEYDSGWITVADRPITVPAGVLSIGQTYYWRVMARDDDEKPSGWTSDPTSASPPGLGRVFQFNIVENARPNPPGAGIYRPSLAVDGGEAHTELVTFEFPAGSDPNVTHTPDVLRYEVQLDLDDDWADGVNLIAETDRISAPGVTRVVMTVESSRLGPDEVGVDDLRYWWRVRTIDPLGATSDWTGSQSFYLNTVNEPPRAPSSGFAPSGGEVVTTAQPLLRWDATTDPDVATDPPGTLHYVVQLSTDASFGSVAHEYTTGVGQTQAQVTAALAGRTEWFWRVRAIDDEDAAGEWSAAQSFVVDINRPPYWTGVNLAAFTPTGTIVDPTPDLNWPDARDDDPFDPPSALEYRVQIDDNPDFNAPEYDSGWVPAGARPLTVPEGKLSIGPTYYWRVMARDADAPSAWTSAPPGATPPGLGQVFQFNIVENARPIAPGEGIYSPSLAVDGGEARTRLVTFRFPAGSDPDPAHTPDVLRYEVQLDNDNDWADGVNLIAEADRISAPGDTRVVMTVEASKLGPDEIGVDDLQYWWRVRTIDPLGAVSDWTEIQTFFLNTVNEPPRAPSSGFNPNNGEIVSTRQPLLTWNATTDPDRATDTPDTLHYVAQLSTDETFATVAFQYTVPAGQTYVQVAGRLADRTQWYWRVKAIDDEAAESAWSLVQTFIVDTNNQVPVLSDGQVDPVLGNLMATFEFSVVYTDADDDAPTGDIRVTIVDRTGVPLLTRVMARDPGDSDAYTDGVTYLTTVNASELPGLGAYAHYYDIAGTMPLVRHPEVGQIVGPVVAIGAEISLTDRDGNSVDVYEEGAPVYVRVRDADENLNPAARDTITVVVSGDVDTEEVVLTETGPNTGVFFGSIAMSGATGASGDGTLNISAGPTGMLITATWMDPDEEPLGVAPAEDTAVVQDTVAPAPIAAGELLVTSGPSGTTVDLDWTAYDEAAQQDVAGYHVWQRQSNFSTIASATLVATLPAGTQTYTATGLSIGSEYWFAVTAFDEVPNENRSVEAVMAATRDTTGPYFANRVPDADAVEVPLDTNISFDVLDDGVGVDETRITAALDGVAITNDLVITPIAGGFHVDYDPPSDFLWNRQITVRARAYDLAGNEVLDSWQFSTVTDVTAPQVVNKQFSTTPAQVSFDITDDLSGVDVDTLVFTVNGVDVTAALSIDARDPLKVRVVYRPTGGWPFNALVQFSVDVADNAGNAAATDTWTENGPSDSNAPILDQFLPADGASNVSIDTDISFRVRDSLSGIDVDSLVMTVNGMDVSADLVTSVIAAAGVTSELTATYSPPEPLNYGTTYKVHVEAADTVGNRAAADWSFTTAPEPTWEITGVVTDADGAPLPGVDVTAGGVTVGTDGNGIYRITGLLAGTYTVVPSFPEYDFTPSSQDVTVGPNARDVNFVGAKRTYRISGRVVDGGGQGVQGVRVSDGTREAITDAAGNYAILNVPGGLYTVTCSRDADNDGFEDFTYTPASRTVNVAAGDVTGVNFTATAQTYTITGTISDSRGNRIAGVTVSDGVRTAITNEAGQFTIGGVPAGTVTLTPVKSGMAFAPATLQVTVPPSSTGNNFTAYAEFTRRFAAGLKFVAVPATPPARQDRAVDVFGTTQVARWDATAVPPKYISGVNQPDHTELTVRPGAGFFVKFPAATTVRVPGDPVSSTVTFSVGVNSGWNMLGNMYEAALPMANITAAGSTQIRPFAFIYDPAIGGYRLIAANPAFNAARNFLEVWEGAWFRVVGPSGTLNIAAPVGVSAAALVSGPAAQAEVPEGGWLLPIEARAAGRADVTTLAGVGSGPDAQGYRVENPPQIPGSVDVYFTGAGGELLAHDIRPAGAGAMVWTFAVETELPNTEVELTLPDLSGVPSDLAVYLTDEDTGQRMYARTLPAYTFVTDADGAVRHFSLEVVPRGADNLTIRSAAVQNAGGGLMVTYDVSTDCAVSMEVLNVAGRVVRTLIADRAVPAGQNTQLWDLRSTAGTAVPAGTYLIKIQAVAENGQRVQALRSAQITR